MLRFAKKRNSLASGAIFLLLFQIAGFFIAMTSFPQKTEAWWDGDWTYRKKLTFDNSAQAENLASFPVLVKLSASNFDFSKAKDNGEDIHFIDSDDSTVLDYEIEFWDKNSSTASIWVEVPQINASSNTDYIYMYYGNASDTDSQNASGVWNSSYKGIYHFGQTAGNYNDSTGLNNCTSVNVLSRTATGKISYAPDFEATSAAHRIGCGAQNITGNVSQEAWINLESSGTRPIIQHAASGETEATNVSYGLELDVSSNIWQQWEYGAGTNETNSSTATVSTGTLTYVAAVRDVSANTVTWYINGNASGSATSYTNDPTGGTSGALYIGGRISSAQWFDGIIDELRISNSTRSASWIKASYLSESDSFITFGTEENVGSLAISSAASQTFGTGDSTTGISQITITESASPSITSANDIRIKIPSTFNMTWDEADTTATIGGTAQAKTSTTVSYEDSNKTLVINVTSNLSASETLTVSGLSFKSFSAASSADNLELEVANDGSTVATDDKTITISTSTITVASATSQPSNVTTPSTDTVLGSASISRNVTSGSVTAVTLKENSGTINAATELENIELWLSSDDSWDSGDNQLGNTGSFDGADGEVTFTESFTVTTSTKYLIARGDVISGVTTGKTFELQFKTISTTDTVSGSPLNITGTSTVIPYWWDEDWLYRQQLTFDNGDQGENLTNFPALVKLTSSNFDFSNAKSNGEDVRFVDANNSTELSYEIEYWNAPSEKAFVWVEVPQIDASSETDYIYMYYGNSSATDAQDPSNVWSNGFAAVYHFAQQSGFYQDSTSNNNDSNGQSISYGVDSSRNNTSSTGIGYFPKLNSNGGTSIPSTAGDYIAVPDSDTIDFGTSGFTIFIRANADVDEFDSDMLRKGSTGIAENSWWKIEWGDQSVNNRVHFLIRVSGTDRAITYVLSPDGSWHNFWGVRNTSDTTIKLYIDGTQRASGTGNNGSVSNSANMGIGSKDTYNDDFFDGYLDEVRLINTVRSANWIAAEDLSFDNTFITFGSETQGPPDAPSGISASLANNTDFSVSWTDNSSNETGFKIERNTDGGAWGQIATDTASPYVDTSTSENHEYQYRVRAYNTAGHSAYQAGSASYTLAPTPTNLLASSVSLISIILSVDSLENEEADSSGYYFSRSGANSGWIQTNSWTDTGLTCSRSYSYTVKYRNGDGVETDSISLNQSTSICGGLPASSSSGSSESQPQADPLTKTSAPAEPEAPAEAPIENPPQIEIQFPLEIPTEIPTETIPPDSFIEPPITHEEQPPEEIPAAPGEPGENIFSRWIAVMKVAGGFIDLVLDSIASGSHIAEAEPQTESAITTVTNNSIHLTIRPDEPVRAVKGFIVFKPKQFGEEILKNKLFAAAISFGKREDYLTGDEELILVEFEYTDPDGDGIYTADIQAPPIKGEYEILTIIEFEDPGRENKEIRKVMVVDPKGYIYAKLPGGELRISEAVVSLFQYNEERETYELWKAVDYKQKNPQTTDATGEYSFLVPEGTYYITVEHDSYKTYQSEIFPVLEGNTVTMNIELKGGFELAHFLNWKILLGLLVIILLYLVLRMFAKTRIGTL